MRIAEFVRQRSRSLWDYLVSDSTFLMCALVCRAPGGERAGGRAGEISSYQGGSHPSYMRSPTTKPPPCQLTIVAYSALGSDCNILGIKMAASIGWSLTLLNVRSILSKSSSLLDVDVMLERRKKSVSLGKDEGKKEMKTE